MHTLMATYWDELTRAGRTLGWRMGGDRCFKFYPCLPQVCDIV